MQIEEEGGEGIKTVDLRGGAKLQKIWTSRERRNQKVGAAAEELSAKRIRINSHRSDGVGDVGRVRGEIDMGQRRALT